MHGHTTPTGGKLWRQPSRTQNLGKQSWKRIEFVGWHVNRKIHCLVLCMKHLESCEQRKEACGSPPCSEFTFCIWRRVQSRSGVFQQKQTSPPCRTFLGDLRRPLVFLRNQILKIFKIVFPGNLETSKPLSTICGRGYELFATFEG